MTIQPNQHWHQTMDADQILWLALDRQGTGVNSLSAEIITELNTILDTLLTNQAITGVVIRSAKHSGFIAGADIEQFVKLQNEEEAFALVRQAQIVFEKLATLRMPTVALIDGFCLGGGLELVLACRYRVIADEPKTQIGAPEVKLGLIPGFGGTVRLPRLVGVLPAMDLNLSGRPISGKAAAKIGLADVAVPQRDLERAARYYILQKPTPAQPNLLQRLLALSLLRPLVAGLLEKKLKTKVNKAHYPAPYIIVNNWRHQEEGEAAFVQEAHSIAKLLVSPTSRNLVRVFFLQTRLKGLGKDARFAAQHVHVIGAGVMGGDIAAWCAMRGLTVTLQDRLPELIAPAIRRANELFIKKLKLPRLVQAAMDKLIADPVGLGIPKADVVIEAVSENLAVKQAIYQLVEPQLKPHALLATNTSSLSLEQLSQVLKDPTRLLGIHFFNPVAKMQLVEVVHAEHTSPQLLANTLAFVRHLDKLPLPVKSRAGFLVNRVLMPYLLEAMILLDEGILATTIDRAAVDFGMPMGPVELADAVGLDVVLAVAEILVNYYGGTVPERLRQMVSKGELGRKTQQGFYRYENSQPVKSKAADDSHHTVDALPLQAITDRLILAMLNEAVACLREKIVEDADLLDAGMIFGIGFPPFRGGPLHYAQSTGIEIIIEKLRHLTAQFGQRFQPDEGWDLLRKPPLTLEETIEVV